MADYKDKDTDIVIRDEKELTAGFARRTRNMTQTQVMWEALEALCSAEDLEKIDEMDAVTFEAFINRYNAFKEDSKKA